MAAVRVTDYEASMKWLSDASKLKINPMIPRKIDATGLTVSDRQMSTFQSEYNPWNNPWIV